MKKVVSLLLLVVVFFSFSTMTAMAEPSAGDLFRYIPTQITVTEEEAMVEGFFINMSEKTISNITELKVTIYNENDIIIAQGSFDGDNLKDFSLKSGRMIAWSFTWQESKAYLNTGSFTCDSDTYALFSCKFNTSN